MPVKNKGQGARVDGAAGPAEEQLEQLEQPQTPIACVTEPAALPDPIDVQIAIPLADAPPTGYRSRHIEVQLKGDEPETMRRFFEGLDRRGERLPDGRRVQSNADAIRWLLGKIGGAA